jgi:hypothetical protein
MHVDVAALNVNIDPEVCSLRASEAASHRNGAVTGQVEYEPGKAAGGGRTELGVPLFSLFAVDPNGINLDVT